MPRRLLLMLFTGMLCASPAAAQLRIVTYNTNTFGTQDLASSMGLPSNNRVVRASADIVFEAIGEEIRNGVQRPADIILLQEQQQPDTTTQNLVNRLNAIYAGTGITYARGFEVGNTTSGNGFGTPNAGEIRQSVVYRTDSVELIDEDSFGDLVGGIVFSQPRETLLHQFRPVGFGPEADLFIFNSHFEAGDDDDIVSGIAENLAGREIEANQIRTFIDNNGLGDRNVIVAGDLNVDSNFETSGLSTFGGQSALEILAADGPGRVLDPLFRNGQSVTFTNNFALRAQLTQSPSDGAGPLVGGGIDDRFDFILQSDELLDREGVASIPNSLRPFGNNGSTFNDQINDGNTIQIPGLTSFTTAQVLNALEAASDHLPVIEDFQLPAVLGGSAELSTESVEQGGDATLSIQIENVSPVDVPIGADELEYSVSVTGDLDFSAFGLDVLVGDPDFIEIPLDTTTIGDQSFQITLTTSSPGSPVTRLDFDVTLEVEAIDGDLNQDGVVNAGDFTTFRDGFDEGLFTIDDFLAFQANFGASALAADDPLVAPVPEPSALFVTLGMLAAVGRRRRCGR